MDTCFFLVKCALILSDQLCMALQSIYALSLLLPFFIFVDNIIKTMFTIEIGLFLFGNLLVLWTKLNEHLKIIQLYGRYLLPWAICSQQMALQFHGSFINNLAYMLSSGHVNDNETIVACLVTTNGSKVHGSFVDNLT